jgi:hypothetical protein
VGTLTIAVAVLWPRDARADFGLPMLAIVWPGLWLAFVPIVLIEALVARRILRLSFRDCLRLSLIVNAWSTLVGVLVAWLALLLIEMGVGWILVATRADLRGVLAYVLAPFMAPWIGPEPKTWQAFAAAAFLCIPFCAVSTSLEAWAARRYGKLTREQARAWTIAANLATYAPGAVALSVLAWASASRP